MISSLICKKLELMVNECNSLGRVVEFIIIVLWTKESSGLQKTF